MSIERLRFDKSEIKLHQAAITLATSQEPWAEYVACSVYDYVMAGYDRSNQVLFAVMRDSFWELLYEVDRNPYESMMDHVHRLSIRPDSKVEPGWVELSKF